MADTDSLVYHFETEDFYEDTKNNAPTMFDTSDYPPDHPAVEKCGFPIGMNKKVPGLFKDELKEK